MQPIGAHCCEVMYFECFSFRGELGFLNFDGVCMCSTLCCECGCCGDCNACTVVCVACVCVVRV